MKGMTSWKLKQSISLWRSIVRVGREGNPPNPADSAQRMSRYLSFLKSEIKNAFAVETVAPGGHNDKLFPVLLFGRVFPKGPTALCLDMY